MSEAIHSRRPRLAFITSGVTPGGAITFLVNIGKALKDSGLPYKICSLDDREQAPDFQSSGVDLWLGKGGSQIYEDRIIQCVLELVKYQPTHVVASLGPGAFEVLRYVPSGIPRIGMVQSDDPGVYACLADYAQWMDATVGVSSEIHSKLKQHAVLNRLPAFALPYGVVLPETGIASEKSHDNKHPIRIIYFGRLTDGQKRVRIFPQILKHLVESRRPFVWTIAGSGVEEEYLKREMTTLSPDQVVRFVGWVPASGINDLLASQDIMLLASAFEGLPLSLLEAMGRGVVPVVSDLSSGIPEVVDSSRGILVNTDDIEGYARAVLELDADRKKLNKLSSASREFVQEHYSLISMRKRWLQMALSLEFRNVKWPSSARIQRPLPLYRHIFHPLLRPIRRIHKRLAFGKLS